MESEKERETLNINIESFEYLNFRTRNDLREFKFGDIAPSRNRLRYSSY